MKLIPRPVLSMGIFAFVLAAPAFASDDRSSKDNVSNPNHCQVVERQPGDRANNSGSLSTTVTAGNGHVSASSSGPNSVTVHSGNGGTSSSSTSSSVTTGSGGQSTTVTTANGHCVIYVNPGDKKDH